MSNFVHKVKDAITDHDKPVTRSQASENRTQNTANPFTSTYKGQNAPAPGMNNPDTATESYTSTQPSSNIRNSSSAPDTSSSASSPDINAGPHNSKIANKMDPRVDSDLDHRAQAQAPIGSQRQTGTTNMGRMDPSNTAQQQRMNPNTMPTQQQGMNQNAMPTQQGQGLDTHSSSEDTFSKSTKEHHTQHQPGQFGFDNSPTLGQEQTFDEDFSSSTQENKSHKSTSHVAPCTTAAGGQQQMAQSSSGQPMAQGSGGNFGGSAVGGSSSVNAAPDQVQYNPRQKFRTEDGPVQGNVSDQRGGY